MDGMEREVEEEVEVNDSEGVINHSGRRHSIARVQDAVSAIARIRRRSISNSIS